MAGSRGNPSDIYTKDARALSDDELSRIRNATYEELKRASGTMHLVPVVESVVSTASVSGMVGKSRFGLSLQCRSGCV
jgi:hypothetical protein